MRTTGNPCLIAGDWCGNRAPLPFAFVDTARDTALDTASAGRPGPKVRPAEVYPALRAKLMRGEFPLRGRLVEEQLALELGVSRTPVREAMRRLLSDGLVVRGEDGYHVAIPDL